MGDANTNLPLRLGILGAARIAPRSIVHPAQVVPEIDVVGVAARQPARAGDFQIKHGLPIAFPSYEAMLASDKIDAVYNPLPNSLHCEWTIKALEAGKHVLCEKPFASNTAEAEQMASAAQRADRRLMEAFHWRYHPLADRALEIIESGELGPIRYVEANVCFPLLSRKDIRWSYDLGGGALMDAGCYAVHLVRTLAGDEPEVMAARPTLRTPDVDRAMEADLRFADGRTGGLRCSMFSWPLVRMSVTIRGDAGELYILNPVLPQLYHRLTVTSAHGSRRETLYGDSTYTYQLRAFARLVRDGTPVPTDPADAVANMRVIDAIYEKAGMRPRGT